ncbi:MAG: fibrillarin-like rRNA/tRNA 2'-O-methyltransferase [Candidatus Woesearchaeota archaeon]
MHNKFEEYRKAGFLAERSKIQAAIQNGFSESYLRVQSMLYVGAAHGYTISHIYDLPIQLYAVEKSKEMMRYFLPIAENLPNVMPILADASSPDSFAHHIPASVDVVFQDIAQRDQTGIFVNLCRRFLSPHGVGILALKAPATSSTAEPAAVFADTREQLMKEGMTIVQEISLEPYQSAHRLFVVHQEENYDYF